MLSGQTILVTGATGQVAFPIVRALARERTACSPSAASRRPRTARASPRSARRSSQGDLARGELDAIPEALDSVLHFAVARSAEARLRRRPRRERRGRGPVAGALPPRDGLPALLDGGGLPGEGRRARARERPARRSPPRDDADLQPVQDRGRGGGARPPRARSACRPRSRGSASPTAATAAGPGTT